jgi:hypothetical protein
VNKRIALKDQSSDLRVGGSNPSRCAIAFWRNGANNLPCLLVYVAATSTERVLPLQNPCNSRAVSPPDVSRELGH